jgi:ATP-dependent helicase/nuclease subunit A
MTRAAYTRDGHDVSREAFYAIACDPQRSVVVEACAGAGKTWMLVSRVLRALLAGAQPHEILAITFTRKAAGEMRARLAEWLAEYAGPTCDAAHRIEGLRQRGLSQAEAQTLEPTLATLHEQVLRAGRPVEIRTFHAWFSQLLRAAPLDLLSDLGLQPDMDLIEDVTEHHDEVYRRFHAAVLADATLLADYRQLVLTRGRSQLRAWLDAAWSRRVEVELADAAGALETSVPSAAAQWPEYAGFDHPAQRLRVPPVMALLKDTATALGRLPGAIPRKQGALLAEAFEHADDAVCFAAAKAALFTGKGELRKKLDADGVTESAELLLHIGLAIAQQTAHEEHVRMLRLARVLLIEFAAYKRGRGLADMADLERCALALLSDAALSGWVQERLDARVRHVLIDEFQDTSPLQWHALHAWLSAYAGAGGGASGQRPPGVFIVGDPKQSIYRFRRAEPRVFDAAREFVLQGLGGNALACDHTRRNAPAVLAAINGVFAQAQQLGAFSGFRPHTTEIDATSAAAVFTLPLVLRPPRPTRNDPDHSDDAPWRDTLTTPRLEPDAVLREREAAQVAAAIHTLVAQQQVAPGDIQVLCRKRASLRLVAKALAALHLPFAAAEDFALLSSPEVRDLVALLDVLASPQHDLSLAHALRSPVFDASDADLIALATQVQAGPEVSDWWTALQTLPQPSAALRRARELLARWQAAAQRLPPHDLLDAILAEGEVRERYAAAVPAELRPAALAAIDALLGQALMQDGARYATPYNFVRALRRSARKVAAPVRADAVQLLTVHGAKGLEARVVFVMDADPEAKNADTATLLVDWPVESPHPLQCAFVYNESQCPPSLALVFEREVAARRREELNGLYVAMTRARERLVFSATEPHRPSADESWWRRISAHAVAWAPAAVSRSAPPALTSAAITLRCLPLWPTPPEAERTPSAKAEPPAVADNPAASRLGQAVHRVLEWAAAPGRTEPDITLLASAAAREFGVTAADVAQRAGRIWHSPDCARFFRGEALRWAGNEVPVSEAGELLRIDRLVELDEGGGPVWWVLDYKLQHAPQQIDTYRAQLQRYRRAVQAAQPGAVVRCALIGGDGALREIE